MTHRVDLSAVRGGAELQQRPAALDDVGAVVELLTACNRHDMGEEMVDEGDIIGDWQRPSFDLATESVAILEGGRLVAYADVFKGHRVEAGVHPDARGRGIGSALVRWTWDVARARGSDRIAQPVPAPSDAVPLLESHGYRPTHTAWFFELPRGTEMTRTGLPVGVRLREFQPGVDDQAAYEVIETAFTEWTDREPSTFGDWKAASLDRPGFEPWQLQLAVDEAAEDDPVIGAVHVLPSFGDPWVSEVAVRRDRRGLGLGRALLVHALDVARVHLGEDVVLGLATDSRTGKRDLYEHVGMTVKHTFVHYAKDL